MAATRLMDSADSTTSKRVRKVTAAPGVAAKAAYRAGETIADKYELVEILGEGGMGAVWKAHNSTLDIDVAVKLIRSEDAEADDGPLLGDRLLQEARAAARLGHPAIGRVFDFGVTDRGNPFIVMELLHGEDLAQALARRGRISATKAVATLLPIAHALDAAHAKGIVHRDIKPENIFLARAEDGRVQPKIVDFGIAKVERGKSHRLTQTGTMLGSPLYMSPEQARGDDVDHLADVWALCVVLYEMVTGRTPFEGKNYNALLYSIIADDPPALTSFSAGDDELWAIVRRGFEKDPDQRWQSVRELATELARWMIARNQHEDITGSSLSAQWTRRAATSGDMLASVMPPPGDNTEAGAASSAQLSFGRTTQPEVVDATVGQATVHRRGVTVQRNLKRRLVAVALASAAVGAVVVVLLAVRARTQEGANPGDVSEVPLAQLPSAAPPEEPVPQANSGVAADVQSAAAPSSPLVDEPPATASAPPPSSGDTAALTTAASSGTKNPKAAKGARPTKKSKLKNPFD